jgi:streptogramin lyase
VFFTDMVGSTDLTARLGDRRWRVLLAEYHREVRRALRNSRGREVDNAGDGFFAVFDQPGRAISCACELTDSLHSAGIEVRTGIHMGEVETIGAKLGGIAVHIGARVASIAKPGDVVVSSTIRDVVSGAGYKFDDAGSHTLKGVPGEWRLYHVSWPGAKSLDPAALQAWESPALRRRGGAIRRLWPVALLLMLAAVTLGAVAGVLHSQRPALIVPSANTAAQIDASAQAFRADVPVGNHPTGVAIGGGAVWVINASDQTLTRIDASNGHGSPAKAVGGTPTGIAYGADSVWVSSSSSGAVFRFDATGRKVRQIQVPDGVAGMAFGVDALWIASPLDNTVIRVDPVTNGIAAAIPVGRGPQAVAVGGSAIWVANSLDHTLSRIDAATNMAQGGFALGSEPDALAADSRAVWVVSTAANTVTRFDVSTLQLIVSIPVGTGPVDVSVADDGGVWIAESTAEKVERIDARSNRAVASLTVHGHPEAIDSQGGFLWAAVSAD